MPKAVVLTGFGPPDVLAWSETEMPEPAQGQICIQVRAAGVGPTDLMIRQGNLQAVFPLPANAILGFEVAGVVAALGPSVAGVSVGDEVAALLPRLGGYAEYALASSWTAKPPDVAWNDAAALPASAEAAVGILKQLHVTGGETLLVLGGAGSVGTIATQLALAQGLTVISAVSSRDEDLVQGLGAIPVRYGADLVDQVRGRAAVIHAVLDAAGKGGLEQAIELAGGPARVMTLADDHAAALGVRLSAPTPDRAPEALDQTMALLASGDLRLRPQRQLPLEQAAEAHALLESGSAHEKLVLTVG